MTRGRSARWCRGTAGPTCDTEGGLAIIAASSVPNLDGSPLFSFNGQEDLAAGLGNQAVIHQCLAAYLATFSYGTNQACLRSSQVSQLQSGAIGIAEAFDQLAAELHFTRRDAQ